MAILLNDLLRLDNLENCKVRFLTQLSPDVKPLDFFKNNDLDELFKWQFWNYSKQKSFKVGQTAIGLVRIEGDHWLLFDISTITKDLNIYGGAGFEYEMQAQFKKYFGRVVVEYKNKSQNLVRLASSVLSECEVSQILEVKFDDDEFPGYDRVNLSWKSLKRVINKSAWKTALENQKGVYLITDSSNGKMYVGAAYGKDMIRGRWSDYLINGHGGNEDLKALEFNHIQRHFTYSILDIYKSTTNDGVIRDREKWWKDTLLSKTHGYNKN